MTVALRARNIQSTLQWTVRPVVRRKSRTLTPYYENAVRKEEIARCSAHILQ
ncbi:hypothetical protein HMPREF1548_03495 [Clostridium sp. KLE 1755]|nr:hypothetical protein HMPREF1548_03495 [Clostridium sp. KLE 1755]